MSEKTRRPLNLSTSLQTADNMMQAQQIKSVGNQPRPTSLSPNVIAITNARALSTPAHVSNVQVSLVRASDNSSKVTVSFKRDPSDPYFSEAIAYVSGYKDNPAPCRIASGQSPISFSLENTGEAVSVTVQANGNLGPAPLATAPNATLKLDKTNLATVATTAGNGPATGATFQTNGVANSTQSLLNLADGTDIGVTESAGTVTIASKLQRKWAGFAPVANQGFSGNFAYNMSPGSVGFGTNAQAAVGAVPSYWEGDTGVGAGSNTRIVHQGTAANSDLTIDIWRNLEVELSVVATTQVRTWIGFVISTGTLALNNDIPTSTFGFRYSTNAGDTTWQCYSHGGSSSTIVNSGVAIDTNPHTFKIVGNGGSSLRFYIDTVLVATISTNILAAGTGIYGELWTDNVSVAQSRKVRFYGWYHDHI